MYGIIICITFSMIFWFCYNRYIRKYNGDKFEFTLFKFPKQIKCLYPNVALKEKKNICEDADFDGWSILHVILYFFMGLIFPGEYIFVIIISFISELWEYISGWRARWLVDPLVNFSSYFIASQLSYKYNLDFCSKYKIKDQYALISSLILILFLFINNPKYIGLKDDE